MRAILIYFKIYFIIFLVGYKKPVKGGLEPGTSCICKKF